MTTAAAVRPATTSRLSHSFRYPTSQSSTGKRRAFRSGGSDTGRLPAYRRQRWSGGNGVALSFLGGGHGAEKEWIEGDADQERDHGIHHSLRIASHHGPETVDHRDDRDPLVGLEGPSRQPVIE